MNESERKQVVKHLKELKDKILEKESKEKELDELKQNEIVQRYFELIKEIHELELLNPQIVKYTMEEIIEQEFSKSFKNDIYSEYRNISKCSHPIWIYMGSFYNNNDEYGYESRSYKRKVYNEQDEMFGYNIYKCLACGKETDCNKFYYKAFEKDNFVLKKYSMNTIKFNKLQNEYYSYLFNHKVDVSQKKLIKSFNERYE